MLTASFINALSFTARGLHRLADGLATTVRNRTALKQLSELDERTLSDIGLTRADISSANAVPFHRDPFLIDPFEDRRRIKAAELEVLARWPRPLPEKPYFEPRTVRCTAPAE